MFDNLISLLFGLTAFSIFFILPFVLMFLLMRHKHKKHKAVEDEINKLPIELRQKAKEDQNRKFIISFRSFLALVGVVSISKHYYAAASISFISLGIFELYVWLTRKK